MMLKSLHCGVSSKDIQKARQNAKRNRTSVACGRCKAGKTKCSDYRPCKTCILMGNQNSCKNSNYVGAKRTPSVVTTPDASCEPKKCNKIKMFSQPPGVMYNTDDPSKWQQGILHNPNQSIANLSHRDIVLGKLALVPESQVIARQQSSLQCALQGYALEIDHVNLTYRPAIPPFFEPPLLDPLQQPYSFLPPAVGALLDSAIAAPFLPPPPSYALHQLLLRWGAAPPPAAWSGYGTFP